MGATAKAKTKSKRGRRLSRRSNRPASTGVPAWAVTSPEEKKELEETIRRIRDGSEKLTRILL